MSPNRRILLNIAATYGRSLYALVCGLFISRWVLAALGKTDLGLYGVVGGMMVIALLAFTMRPGRGRNATLSLSMGSDPMEVQNQRFEEQEFCAKFAQNSFGVAETWISR